MTSRDLADLTITELAPLISQREISSRELVQASLDRINAYQNDTNAFVAWDGDLALEQAQARDDAAADGRIAGPLHGIPVAVKDNYWTAEFPTTACSAVHESPPSDTDATAVARLRKAGAIIIGKTNMHEWAYGATNEVSSAGPTRNPWNLDHVTGGSSGGSGAALAARMVPAALGSDTGGSVRIPAAACGVSGIKPTYGGISRYGVLPLSWSLDVPGPMARSARDLMTLLGVMSCVDPKDPTSRNVALPAPTPEYDKRPLRLAVPRGNGFERAGDVSRVFDAAADLFRAEGAEISDVKISDLDSGFGAWKIIMHAEAATYHESFLREKAEFYSDNVRNQLEAGRCLAAVDYLKAQQFRSSFNGKLDATLGSYDAMILPTLPVTAPKIGQDSVSIEGKTVTSQNAMTYVAWIANFAGLPAVSVPCGFGENGLPVAMMIIGKAGHDMELLAIADHYQSHSDWHRRAPDLK